MSEFQTAGMQSLTVDTFYEFATLLPICVVQSQ
jgi:hypothetical protein